MHGVDMRPHLSSRSEDIFSNWARVMVASMCFGPSAVAVMNGSEMLVLDTPDSSTCTAMKQSSTHRQEQSNCTA